MTTDPNTPRTQLEHLAGPNAERAFEEHRAAMATQDVVKAIANTMRSGANAATPPKPPSIFPAWTARLFTTRPQTAAANSGLAGKDPRK